MRTATPTWARGPVLPAAPNHPDREQAPQTLAHAKLLGGTVDSGVARVMQNSAIVTQELEVEVLFPRERVGDGRALLLLGQRRDWPGQVRVFEAGAVEGREEDHEQIHGKP